MSNLDALVNRLQAWLQEEIAAQRCLFALLSDQEAAIRSADADAVEASGRSIERELASGSARERRRREILVGLGRAFGVEPRTLTLTSVGERLGVGTPAAERLLRLRHELRETSASVLKRGRRIASLARYHGALFHDLMHVLLGLADEDGQPHRENGEGVLLDAQA